MMSPTPVSNDPGDDGDRHEVEPGDVPSAAGLIVVAESSSDDEDDQNENLGHEIGYQLLTPGMHFQGPAGPGDSDDDEGDDDDSGRDSGDDGAPEIPAAECHADDSLSSEGTGANSHLKPHLQLPPPPANQDLKELQELWKTPRVDSQTTPMAQDQIDTIKSAMAGFNLPSSCLPQWVNTVPETEWKAQLLLRLGSSKGSGKTDETKMRHSAEKMVVASPENDTSAASEPESTSRHSSAVLELGCCDEGDIKNEIAN